MVFTSPAGALLTMSAHAQSKAIPARRTGEAEATDRGRKVITTQIAVHRNSVHRACQAGYNLTLATWEPTLTDALFASPA